MSLLELYGGEDSAALESDGVQAEVVGGRRLGAGGELDGQTVEVGDGFGVMTSVAWVDGEQPV